MPGDLPPTAKTCRADDLLALALAAGRDVAEAAAAAGVSERTAYRRLADPAFKRRVAELRAGMVDRASGRLADGMADAAAALRDLLGHPDGRVRLGAARAMLEAGVRVREAAELEARLAALENARR
jgi:hypothetical protein